jgi:RNA polymerase sigma-70 factor, ECF subfamily
VTLFSPHVLDGVRRGDPAAVGRVYDVLGDRLLAYLQARVRSREVAEDLLEVTFLKLLEKGHTIRGEADVIKPWLFRTAHFTALDHLRRGRRLREDPIDDLSEVEVYDTAPDPELAAIRADTARELYAAMEQLSEEQQQVLLLRYVGELSAPEVAAVIGKNVGAVRALQHRGERSLARILGAATGAPAPSSVPRSSKE